MITALAMKIQRLDFSYQNATFPKLILAMSVLSTKVRYNLELAFEQEQHQAANEILKLAEHNKIEFALPDFSNYFFATTFTVRAFTFSALGRFSVRIPSA